MVKCDDLNEHIRTVERELWVHKARAERHDNRASGVRHKGSRPSVKDTVAEKPKVLDIDTSEAVTKPFNEDEEDDHFSPLPAHLSPFPVPATFSPIIKDISPSEEIDSRRAPRERRRDTRQDVEPTLDVTKDFSNYTHHSPTKPVSIGATAAHLMRYHDETTSENSTSLPHHAPASYLSKRQEKQREGASLSRNHSSGSSGTGRNSGSKLRQAVRLPEQAIPDSSDEAEVNARHSRRRWLDDLLADPAGGRPSSNLAGSPISAENMSIGDEAEVPPPPARAHRDNRERERERDRERERERDREPDPVPRRDREQTKSSSIYVNRPSAAYEPQPVPATSPSSRSSTPPPVLPRPTPISHASTAAQQFERERERRRRESGASSRGNGTPATEAPYGSLKDTTNASIYVADDAPPRRQPYPERRVSSDRQPPMQTKGWRNPGGLEA
ncbi:hypothetical protein FA95DRAFT_898677 [Auriscalpium vulgare]|uniref:Uncharacterized protein n=1 Tax=Auriscalpium vulgare TaxID=40419 RepID=A0ACB8RZU2_9AGAM|nr:hypothetical protein FA95DRAFT_898677 [Auriscalpium vulgare]